MDITVLCPVQFKAMKRPAESIKTMASEILTDVRIRFCLCMGVILFIWVIAYGHTVDKAIMDVEDEFFVFSL